MRAAGIGVVMVGLAALATAAGALGTSSGQRAVTPGSPCKTLPASRAPVPLTSAQCVAAAKIVARSSYLHTLLAGINYTISKPEPWGGDAGRNLGAVFQLRLSKPLTVARTSLPVADFPRDDGDAYTPRHVPVSIHNATSLTVFVDLHRRAVVWVMPKPEGSEGPPPTSIPPFTLPAGFTPGAGSATPADAAAGLVLGGVTFDPTGRVFYESWSDPLTGKTRTDYFDPSGKLFESSSSVLHKTTISWFTVGYYSHQWSSATLPLDEDGNLPLVLDSRTLPASMHELVSRELVEPVGQQTVDGVVTQRFHGRVGLILGDLWISGSTGDVWIDPTTYLPVKETIVSGSKATVEFTTYLSWLPSTTANSTTTPLQAPTGYKHVAIQVLPPSPLFGGD